MKKLLFTPGPLTTSLTVKQAMLEDVGSRDFEFIEAVREIRSKLLELAKVSREEGYETVIMQGSGTFGIESVVSCALGPGDVLGILVNGAYGERIVRMAEIHHLPFRIFRRPEDELVTAADAESLLLGNPEITHLACIHSETTTGLINPVEEIGRHCHARQVVCIVDAMSSFGGMEMDMGRMQIDFLVSSSNKCIEGVPGFAFVLCRRSELEKCRGRARTLSLDLYEQWKGLENSGQFRFTPPTLSLMAFRQALRELDAEGGIPARARRYRANKTILDQGMAELGFRQYLSPHIQGHIISSFLYPEDPDFDFEEFYKQLNSRGFVIYPGKLSKARAFRIGNIGQLFPEDLRALVKAIGEIMAGEGIRVSS
jgi:2-aminoethylphosphonate-pyruvate transaminase